MSPLYLLLCIFGLTCSQVSADLANEAIVGGDYAKKDAFKYQVSLQFKKAHFCGGAIIADRFILTAAHCVAGGKKNVRMQPCTVVAGTENLKDKHAISAIVETVYVHKEFDFHIFRDDIAILKLKDALDLKAHSHKIEKINLPRAYSKFADVTTVFSGFGFQKMKTRKTRYGTWEEYGGKSDRKLKYAKVRIIPNDKCVKMNKPQPIFPTLICGQIVRQHKYNFEGICKGDSGGPLVFGGEIIGIASSSPLGCNDTSTASTYTHVASYLNLIHNVINGKPETEVIFANIPAP